MTKKQTENEIKKQITDYLKLNGYKVFRINNVGIFNAKRQCYIFKGEKGVSDLLAISKRKNQILFIETKVKPRKPTAEQLEFLDLVDGITSVKGILAYNIEDLIK